MIHYLRSVPEQEMVLDFLVAEMNSPRFADDYPLEELDADRGLIDRPDLTSSRENRLRGELLRSFRGYERNGNVFKGLPEDITWWDAEIDREDLGNVRYADITEWRRLSGGTRRVEDGARYIAAGKPPIDRINDSVREAVQAIREGRRLPRIIGVSRSQEDLPVLMEGHARATAYVLAGKAAPERISAIIGISPRADAWECF